MWQYVVKRLILMIPTLIGAALVIFFLMNLVPGDMALLIIGGDQGGDVNVHELAKLRGQLGLDRPLVTVGYRNAAVISRMTRSTVLEVRREDYVRTAWAKGLRERWTVTKHALKNAILPVITITSPS